MPYLDTHAHLFDGRFLKDLSQVLARAKAAGVEHVLTLGIDADSSRVSVQQAVQYPMLRAAVGIQPNHTSEAGPTDWDTIVQLAEQSPQVAAIGETGLDRYWDRAPFATQEDYFERHLELAHRLHRPVAIHCREAEADVVRMLRARFERFGPLRGIMHSYCGDRASAEACLAMGLHVSFAGMVTYKTAESVREVARMVPADRLLIETDAPYLAPLPVRGKRNEPAFVVHTAECLAQERGESLEQLREQTTRNARAVLGID